MGFSGEGGNALSGSGRSHASGSSGGRRRAGGKAFGASSSEDEIRSTDCTSCGEEEMESESVSEKGKHCKCCLALISIPAAHLSYMGSIRRTNIFFLGIYLHQKSNIQKTGKVEMNLLVS